MLEEMARIQFRNATVRQRDTVGNVPNNVGPGRIEVEPDKTGLRILAGAYVEPNRKLEFRNPVTVTIHSVQRHIANPIFRSRSNGNPCALRYSKSGAL